MVYKNLFCIIKLNYQWVIETKKLVSASLDSLMMITILGVNLKCFYAYCKVLTFYIYLNLVIGKVMNQALMFVL